MAPALVTDSASALTPGICAALRIELVPMRVIVDGTDLADTTLDAQWFYRRLAAGARVTTSQPAPGALLAAYTRAAEAGAESAWSIHIGGRLSGTIDAAALAATSSSLPVTTVDTGTASMPEGFCVLAAWSALREDPGADVAAVVAAETAGQQNIFVSLTPDALERSGRAGARFRDPIPVLSLRQGGKIEAVGAATDMEHALRLMSDALLDVGEDVTVAVGGGGAPAWADALWAAVGRTAAGPPALRYTVPASMGAHTGPSVGLVISPTRLPADVRAALEEAGTARTRT